MTPESALDTPNYPGMAACLLALPLKGGHDSGRLFMLLDELEGKSIYVLREVLSKFERLAMLWNLGKDSSVRLWLAREAISGHQPVALAHFDASYDTLERCFSRPDGYL